MNSSWKTFLETQPGGVQASSRTGTAKNAPDIECGLLDLSHLGLIRVSGEDAEHFLQGQLSNDVREVSNSHFQMSSYCTPKGRMLANFLVLRYAGDYLLQMPLELLPSVLKRLSMFVLLSKVQVTDASDQLVPIGVAGDCAFERLEAHVTGIPRAPGDAAESGAITLLRLAGERPRFEIIGEAEAIIGLWPKIAENARIGDADWWSLLDIRAGIPTIRRSTVEAFVPQMINMQLIDGVSFTKGCYTGQEVVARMKYLGKLKRRMYLAHADTDTRPLPGDEIFSAGSQSQQGAGKVVNACMSPAGGYDLLAVLEVASADEGDLHLQQIEGPRLELRELPYSLQEPE